MGKENLPQGISVAAIEKHLLPIHFKLSKGDQVKAEIFTGFVIDVESCLFLVTAGHCLKKINGYLEDGWEIARTRLLDNFRENARYDNAVPFQYECEEAFYLFDDDGAADYGLLALEGYRAQLEANGVVGLDGHTWRGQPTDPAMYVLAGIVGDATEADADRALLTHGAVTVEAVQTPSGEFSEPEYPRFYAKFPKNEHGFSPRGMSGGPVFAFRNIDGRIKYWLHAIQSSYFASTREISACFATPFIVEVQKVVRSILDADSSEPENSF